MIERFKPKAALSLAIAIVAGFWAQRAMAEDCASIVKAMEATLMAPEFRQYVSPAGSGERLMSIAVGKTAYMAVGTAGWQKMQRAELIAMALDAESDANSRDCRFLGARPLGGVETLGYQFVMESKSGSFGTRQAKVWIGADGLLRLQESAGASLRYEYDDVEAPVPER